MMIGVSYHSTESLFTGLKRQVSEAQLWKSECGTDLAIEASRQVSVAQVWQVNLAQVKQLKHVQTKCEFSRLLIIYYFLR